MTKSSSSLPRILIIGDSLSLPRLETLYSETWPGILQEKRPGLNIIDRSERGASSLKLVTAGGNGIDTLELYSPDIAIIQLGVTESAPRLFRKKGFEHFFLNSILPTRFRPRYINRVKKSRVRSPERADTPPETFRKNITLYCLRAAKLQTKVILFPIAPPNNALIAKSPHFEKSIDIYNGILRETAEEYENTFFFNPYISFVNLDQCWLDEIHFNSQVHFHVYAEIEKLIKGILE